MKTVKKFLFFLLLFLFVSACLAVWFRFRDDGFFDPSVSDSSITDSTDSTDSSDSSSSGGLINGGEYETNGFYGEIDRFDEAERFE